MQVKTATDQYREDAQYFEQHRQELLNEYPDHWLAVYAGRVAATASTLPRLVRCLEKQGLPRGQVFVEYLSRDPDLLIVTAR